MRAYLVTTGLVFGLIVLAHVLRIAAEGAHVMQDPVFALFTVLAAALSGWALRLLRSSART